jgi:hypothetical protein
MPALRHILVLDSVSAAPRRGESVLWVGATDPPPSLARQHRIIRARTTDEAVALIDSGPAVVRFALTQPMQFVQALNRPGRVAEARAA